MGRSRIYVGNLSLEVDETQLREKFSNYGQISSIEVKNKSNIEGEAVSRFAFINLEATLGNLKQCVDELNGKSWKGSTLKVERAQENFLEKLKRERELNQKEKEDELGTSYSHFQNYKKRDDYEEEDRYNWNNNYQRHENDVDYYEEEEEEEEEGEYKSSKVFKEEDTSMKDEHSNQMNILSQVLGKRDSSVLKHNEYSIRRYDPTLADPQPEACGTKPKKAFKSMKKSFGANLIEENGVKKTVEISSDLKFSGSSSGFSFLSQFSKQTQNTVTDEEKDVNKMLMGPKLGEKLNETISRPNAVIMRKPIQKRRDFFIQADDPRLKEGVTWLTTPLTEEREAEFQNIRDDLRFSYKLRNKHALQQEWRSKKINNRNRRGKSRKN